MRFFVGFTGGIITCSLLYITTHTQLTLAYVIVGMLGGGIAGWIVDNWNK